MQQATEMDLPPECVACGGKGWSYVQDEDTGEQRGRMCEHCDGTGKTRLLEVTSHRDSERRTTYA